MKIKKSIQLDIQLDSIFGFSCTKFNPRGQRVLCGTLYVAYYQWRFQDFPDGEANSNLLFWSFLPKTAWNWTERGREWLAALGSANDYTSILTDPSLNQMMSGFGRPDALHLRRTTEPMGRWTSGVIFSFCWKWGAAGWRDEWMIEWRVEEIQLFSLK